MIQYIFKRLLMLIPILLLISVLTFMLSSVSAGDAARALAEQKYRRPSLEQIELVRTEYGLSQPLPKQYVRWLSNVLRGDFGESYQSHKPVLEELISRLPITFRISILSMGILLLISVPIGIFSALYPDSWIDMVGRGFSFISVAMPSFWLGLILLYIFGARLKLITVIGGGSNKFPFMPALTMAFPFIGVVIRLMRTSLIKTLHKGYIRACRAKGLNENKIIMKHALKNAILPVLTKLGTILGGTLCGASIIESIFSIPGLGKYILVEVTSKDLPVVQGYVLFMAILVVSINLIVDILYSVIDPRIKL